jgi:hypothetical protein
VHRRLTGRDFPATHTAAGDVAGLMAAVKTRPFAAAIMTHLPTYAVSLAQSTMRAQKLARNYAATHAGYSSAPYGKPPPLCDGHGFPASIFTVRKVSKNTGRLFAACNVAHNAKGFDNRRCGFFKWLSDRVTGLAK